MFSTESNWEDFCSSLGPFLPSPALLFEFLPSLSGISYQIFQDGNRHQYLSTKQLVRDREALVHKPEWQKFGHLFQEIFVVGVSGHWFLCPAHVWSPSVDAAFLIEEFNNIDFSEISSVLDLGCGTGVVGISLALRLGNINRLDLVDHSRLSMATAGINAYANGLDQQLAVGTHIDTNITYDLALVTPYYFPVEKTSEGNLSAAIQNAALQSAGMVNTAKKAARKVLFIYSSTTEKEFCEHLNGDFTKIASMHVPFTLGDNVGNQSVVKTAIDEKRLTERDHKTFPFWHEITIAETMGDG